MLPPLPDIPAPGEMVLDEMTDRINALTSANIRLTVMLRNAVIQRDDAMRRLLNEVAKNNARQSADEKVAGDSTT